MPCLSVHVCVHDRDSDRGKTEKTNEEEEGETVRKIERQPEEWWGVYHWHNCTDLLPGPGPPEICDSLMIGWTGSLADAHELFHNLQITDVQSNYTCLFKYWDRDLGHNLFKKKKMGHGSKLSIGILLCTLICNAKCSQGPALHEWWHPIPSACSSPHSTPWPPLLIVTH